MTAALEVVVTGGVRTPFATAGQGLASLSAAELGRIAVREALERTDVSPADVEELIVGHAGRTPALAREIALAAGLSERVPALTVEREGASGLDALLAAARRIRCGEAGLVVAAGVESMSRAPRAAAGEAAAAERAGRRLGVGRAEQDAFAVESHRRAAAAWVAGRMAGEVVPVPVPPDYEHAVQRDEAIRERVEPDALERLAPLADRRWGAVTAGNSAAAADGAVALIVASAARARELGLPVLARLRAWATVGVESELAALAPALAVPRALRRAGNLAIERLDLVEYDESSAAAVLAGCAALGSRRFCEERLGSGPLGSPNPEALNVNGGAIALGRPLGAAGARLVLALLWEMGRRDLSRGLALCGAAGGQGVAVVVERS